MHSKQAVDDKLAKKLILGSTAGIYTLQVEGRLVTGKETNDHELGKYWKELF